MYVALAGMGLMATSCDQVQEGLNKAKKSAEESVQSVVDSAKKKAGATASSVAETGGEIDPSLRVLIDADERGYLFRRDIPFAKDVRVTQTTKTKFVSGRMSRRSALGNENQDLKGMARRTVVSFDRSGGRTSISLDSIDAGALVAVEGEATQAEPVKILPYGGDPTMAGLKQSLRWDGKRWVLDRVSGPRDFKAAYWGDNLEPVASELLPRVGIVPRSLWFSGNQRVKLGETITLKGRDAALAMGQQGTGTVVMRLEKVEAVRGHPCAVFSITGNFQLKQSGRVDGNTESGEMEIEEGKIWMSLLQPLVLREEWKSIVTVSEDAGGATGLKVQGESETVVDREWKDTSAELSGRVP